jgi:hypothetical protein
LSLASRQQQFLAETGLPFSYMIVVNKDGNNQPPTGDTATAYATTVGATYPVLADPTDGVAMGSPWNGSTLPGKCALAPDMTILTCWTGGGEDTQGYDAIKAHAANVAP